MIFTLVDFKMMHNIPIFLERKKKSMSQKFWKTLAHKSHNTQLYLFFYSLQILFTRSVCVCVCECECVCGISFPCGCISPDGISLIFLACHCWYLFFPSSDHKEAKCHVLHCLSPKERMHIWYFFCTEWRLLHWPCSESERFSQCLC